jgi:hypothetical protein
MVGSFVDEKRFYQPGAFRRVLAHRRGGRTSATTPRSCGAPPARSAARLRGVGGDDFLVCRYWPRRQLDGRGAVLGELVGDQLGERIGAVADAVLFFRIELGERAVVAVGTNTGS